MQRALAIARRGPALDENPQVGCVLLDAEGRIVSEGWHRGAGTPHAEVDALDRLPSFWVPRTAELTAVVTLEPCNHQGRTGPCAQRLVDAGVGAVAYALRDTGAVAGGGAETLRAAGITVIGGVLPEEAHRLLDPWFARQATARGEAPELPEDRPHVVVKWAQTIDGRAAAADGTSQWITGPAARADVHRRRAEADAILVGTGTLIADDPALTARTPDGGLLVPAAAQPIPVVLGRREIPAGSRILAHPALAAHDLDAPLRFSGSDLRAHLAELRERGIGRLFVEGGPTIAGAILAAGLADETLVYVAPALLGGPGLAIGDLGITSMSGIRRFVEPTIERLGDDLLLRARAAADRPDSELTPASATRSTTAMKEGS